MARKQSPTKDFTIEIMSSEAKNLEAITKAIEQHNLDCEYDAVAVAMNPFEVDRLDWDNIAGCEIISDSKIQTGRFRIICAGESAPEEESVEAVTKEREIVTV